MRNISVHLRLVLALLFVSGAKADVYIGWWQLAQEFGYGYLPKVTSDGFGTPVTIYQTDTGFATVKYVIGSTAGWTLTWPDGPYSIVAPSTELAHSPAVGMVMGLSNWALVDIHQGGQDSGSAMWYHSATWGTSSCSTQACWADGVEYAANDTGYNTAVSVDTCDPAISTAGVVEVHQSASALSTLWYRVGTIKIGSGNLSWGPATSTGFSGYAPSVSLLCGQVVLVAQGTGGSLFLATGSANTSTNSIGWGAPASYDTGYNPSVTVQSGGALVEVHQQTNTTGPLLYRTGTVSTTGAVAWTSKADTSYGTGCYPTVTGLYNVGIETVIEVHSEACGKAAHLVASYGDLLVK
jgi:hypothetical protein